MPDCNYCEESFADEDAYLEHLHAAHDEGELSRIDRRRVEQHVGDDDGGLETGPIVLGGLLLFTAGVLVYVTFFVWGGSSQAAGVTHEHGTINMTIEGEQIDFSQDKYQVQAQSFHFERGNGRMWHVHRDGVTLQTGMKTLGITVTESKVSFEDGETYVDSDPNTNVTVLVNGEPVDPASYELEGVENESNPEKGDHIKIVVTNTTDGS